MERNAGMTSVATKRTVTLRAAAVAAAAAALAAALLVYQGLRPSPARPPGHADGTSARGTVRAHDEDVLAPTTVRACAATSGRPISAVEIGLAAPGRPPGRVPHDADGVAHLLLPQRQSAVYAWCIAAAGYEPLTVGVHGDLLFATPTQTFALDPCASRVRVTGGVRGAGRLRLRWWSANAAGPIGEHRRGASSGECEGVATDGEVSTFAIPAVIAAGGVAFELRWAAADRVNRAERAELLRREIVFEDGVATVHAPGRAARQLAGRAGELDLGILEPDPPNVLGIVVDARGRPLEGVEISYREHVVPLTGLFRERGLGPLAAGLQEAVTAADARFAFRCESALEDGQIAGALDLYRPPRAGRPAQHEVGFLVHAGGGERLIMGAPP
jgi:hypothetical protein